MDISWVYHGLSHCLSHFYMDISTDDHLILFHRFRRRSYQPADQAVRLAAETRWSDLLGRKWAIKHT